ncbi:MAG: TonB family protein [Candidatus Tectomicrobia bacterium]|nr:TonB family protein [Candidatus Tectomicrobia bacterium]
MPMAEPAVVRPFIPQPPKVKSRIAAQPRPQTESKADLAAIPQFSPADVQPIVPLPPEAQQHFAATPEPAVLHARQPHSDDMTIPRTPQPAVVQPVPQPTPAAAPLSRTATPTAGMQALGPVVAAVPPPVVAVSSSVATLRQPRDPSPKAILKAEAERLQAEKEEDEIRSYLDLVFQKLESHKRYPSGAERRGLGGRVVLRFTVRRDGEVVDPEAVEVTGHSSFGDAALRALKRVGKLPNFPSDIRRSEVVVEVPISYRIEDN